ncbi:phage tail tape measure protein [Corynebacterium pyruviciproducens]|uniref:phage tail tape measure protein n=1 Tax=Corynebacterium pyruviciproducens TaxID=598660 RepID=UPI0023F15C42|nr:phage tail tape measure protein [Corynebacterium pyruviciproducens]
MAGGKIDILIEPDTKRFVPKMEAGLKGALGAAGKLGAALGVAAGGAEVFRNVIDSGKEFESQLNTLSAVSQATAEQIGAVTEKARELGSDTSLNATSASDAAAAMTELAKGGFSVEQAMDAAKGTLQLASAAQVDAATAATIQSQALQAFGLEATDAARVSDILAGAANASSAEIEDVAMALQQSGTVAAGFGVSIEDTASAVAMFANAGITGSDAGTLLKTALLGLTDQGKPAQRAIEELGLTVYDAQGRFVGLESLFGQLQKAQQSMTDEQYQAAAATLFGSDAIRMSMVAAQQGADGFSELRDAVTRQGQAAEVAAAQTQGLPGAMERIQNAAEDAALGVYDAMKGPLVSGIDVATSAIETLAPVAERSLHGVVNTFGDVSEALTPAKGAVEGVSGAVSGMIVPLGSAAAAMVLLNKVDLTGRFQSASGAISEFGTVMNRKLSLAAKHGEDLTRMGAAIKALEHQSKTFNAFTSTVREGGGDMLQLGRDTRAAARGMVGLDRTVGMAKGSIISLGGAMKGTAKGGISLLQRSMTGLVDVMGGPLAVGIGAVVGVTTLFVQGHQSAIRIQEDMAVAARDSAAAQRELRAAIAGTNGALSDQAKQATEKLAGAELASFKSIGENTKAIGFVDSAQFSWGEKLGLSKDYQAYRDHIKQVNGDYEALKKTLRDVGIPMEDLNRIVADGGDDYTRLMSALEGGNDSARRAATELKRVRDEIDSSVAAARNADPGFAKLRSGIDEIADSGGDAEKRMSGLRKSLQGLGLLPENAQQAMLNLAEQVDNLAVNQAAAVDSSDALGEALVDQDGKIQGSGNNAQELNKAMTELGQSYLKAANQGVDAQAAYDRLEPAVQGIAQAYGLTEEKVRELGQSYGMIPEVVTTLLELEGADQSLRDISAISVAMANVPLGKTIQMETPGSEAVIKAIEATGTQVEKLPDGKSITVTAPTEEAVAALEELRARADSIGNESYTVDMVLDPTPLVGSAAEAEQILAALGEMTPSPQADLIIDKLLSGKDISVGELNYLASLTPTPQADLANELANSKAQDTAAKLDDLNRTTVRPSADLDTSQADRKIGGLREALQSLSSWFDRVSARASSGAAAHPTGTGYIRGRASGGRLPTAGPGTERVDGFLGVDGEGRPLARVDAGEWVINRANSQRYNAELAAINAGTFPKLPGYTDGGKIDDDAPGSVPTVQEVLDFANGLPSRGQQASRPLTGAPYVRGGVDWGDCSGAVSGISRFAAGLAAFAGRFSTFTEQAGLAALGFLPGLGDPATSLNVGWHNNVAAYGDGHTAATAGGTNLEMGGAYGGGMIGGSVGADHPSFDKHAHLPLADASGLEGAEIVNTSVDGVTLSAGGSRTDVSWGAAGKTFDIISSLFGTKLYDQGGLLPHGGMALNLSGLPEPVLTAGQWADLSAFTRSMQQVAAQLPAVVDGVRRASENLDATAAGLEAIAPKDGGRSIADAPASAMDVLDDLTNSFKVAAGNFHANPARFGLNVGGAIMPEVFGGLRDAEKGLNDTRQAAKDGLVEIADREQELAEARAALAELDAKEGGYDKQTKRKIEDAEKAVARARQDGKADKIADAEEKLRRAREDAADKLSEQDKKHAKDRDKAADTVLKAEKNLNTARTQTAQLAAEIGAGEITLAIEAAKAVYNLGKTVYETVKKIADWIIDKINAVEAARVETLSQSADMLAKLAQGVDQAREKLTQLRMNAVNALLAEQQAQWQLGQTRTNFTQTQLRGIVDVANARAKVTDAELSSLRVIGTSVDDLWARTVAGLESGKLTFGETVESVSTAVQNKLALEAEALKAQAEALKANADAALQLLNSSKAAAKAALSAKSATTLLSAQAGRLKAMTQLGDGSVSTPQAMRMQRITQLLAESADWTARDRHEVKIEESRRYERAAKQAKTEAMRLLSKYFGEDKNYGQYRKEIMAVMRRAGDYGRWNSLEGAKKVIEAALKDTSFGRAVQALETQQVEQQIADYKKTLAETKVEVGNLAIDAQYAPQEAKARGDAAVADQQVSYFQSLSEYYKTSDEGVKKALTDLMDFNREQSKSLAESTGQQVSALQGIAETAKDIYNTLPAQGFGYTLPGVAALPPSRVPGAWVGEIAAGMDERALSADELTRIATTVVGKVDVPQVGSRYETREDVEAARRARDEQLRAAIDQEITRTRNEQLYAQLDRRFTALERSVSPQVTISFPDVEYVKTEDVAREMRDGLTKMGARVTVLEARNGANYYKTRM